MKNLLLNLIIATGVVFLLGAFDSAPSGPAPGSAITATAAKGASSGACARGANTTGTTKSASSGSCARFGTAAQATTAAQSTGNRSSNAQATPIVATASGPDACVDCHDDEVAAFKRTTHAKSWQSGMACEQCHGDVAKHIASGGAAGTITNPASLTPMKLSETCLKCHEKTGEQSHARLSEHARAGVACVTCHDVHPSKEQKTTMNAVGKSAMIRGTQTELCLSCHTSVETDLSKPSHHKMKEGAMNCTSCHNPHGADKPHQLRADTKTLCVSCHQDKRGPFVYEHNAQSFDGCLACHENHGSSGRNMLKVRDVRQLCESCHSAEMGIAPAHGRANLSITTEGDCLKCHIEIHGSNRNKYFIN